MAKNKGLGCFSFPIIIFISMMGISIIKTFIPVSSLVAFCIGLFSCSWFLGTIQKTTEGKFSKKYFVYSIMFIGAIIGAHFLYYANDISQKQNKSEFSEKIYREKFKEKGDSITLLSQKRDWKDNYGNPYHGRFSIRETDYISSKASYEKYYEKNRYRKNTGLSTSAKWGRLYQYLVTKDGPKLDLITAKLSEIKKEKQLGKMAFADMVVTLIQDIPYALVLPTVCSSAYQYGEDPVGFMGNLKGDCDTRTVIIYAILSHFGYEVAILNSEYYRHSILGIHMNARGSYKLHRGKRYYAWETTNLHFTIGKLSKNTDNMNHWHIVLTNS